MIYNSDRAILVFSYECTLFDFLSILSDLFGGIVLTSLIIYFLTVHG